MTFPSGSVTSIFSMCADLCQRTGLQVQIEEGSYREVSGRSLHRTWPSASRYQFISMVALDLGRSQLTRSVPGGQSTPA
jgi:hypothetical protein